MAGKVDFRDDGDAAFGSVLNYVAELLLGVEAAVADAVVGLPVFPDNRTVSPSAYLSEAGISLYLYPPALIVGEVPVESVELVGHHNVDVLLGLLYGPEVARAVKVHSAVAEAGLVKDFGAGEYPVGLGLLVPVNCRRKHLLKGFAGVDETVQGRSFNLYVIVFNFNVVLLRAKVGVVLKLKAVAVGLCFYAGSGFKGLDEAADGFAGGFVYGRVNLHGCALDAYSAL